MGEESTLENAVCPSGRLNGICRHVETAVVVERRAKRQGDARLRLDGKNEAGAATVDLQAAIVDVRAVREIGPEDGVSSRRGELDDEDGAVDAFEARAAAQDTGFRGFPRGSGDRPLRGRGGPRGLSLQ